MGNSLSELILLVATLITGAAYAADEDQESGGGSPCKADDDHQADLPISRPAGTIAGATGSAQARGPASRPARLPR